MRIAHVITRMIVGGAQENTLLTLRGHLEHGHEAVLVTGPTEGPEGKLLQEQPLPGLEVVVIPDLCRELAPLRDLRAYCGLRNLFARRQFAVVHTHSSKAGILGRLAARRAGVPVVVHTVHGQAFHPYQGRLANALYIAAEKFAARRCDRIYAVAQAMVEQCVAAGIAPRDRYQVVYSGMELEPFLAARPDPGLRRELRIPPEAVVVGKIARLFELKGHDLLIEAAPAVVQACPETVFLLVGDGLWRDRLEAKIRGLGLTAHFRFTGLVPPAAIPRYVGQMDILAHLSLREGLPRSVVQALAAGLPAVAHPLDGTPEVVAEGATGFLVPPGDPAAVAAALVRLIRDPALRQRLGAAGQARVRHDFDWRTMVATLEASYAALLQAKRAG
ncbi:MAG: glycosyltransferase family 4 protein [Lentisphaeria bacterium]|jgi:glycosyltransferase involved in cell wall biosynthesis